MAYLHWFSNQYCGNCGYTSNLQVLHAQPLSTKATDQRVAKWVESNTEFRAFCCCNHCHTPSTLDLKLLPLTHAHKRELGVDQLNGRMVIQFLNRISPVITWSSGPGPSYGAKIAYQEHQWGQCLHSWFEIIARYPDATLAAPTALPPELAREFEELSQVRSSPKYAAMACRCLLETACKHVLGDEAVRDKSLVQLVNLAIKRMETVDAIADWAHVIRCFGNSAAHENTACTQVEADEAIRFITLFLELLYSYPDRITKLRK